MNRVFFTYSGPFEKLCKSQSFGEFVFNNKKEYS